MIYCRRVSVANIINRFLRAPHPPKRRKNGGEMAEDQRFFDNSELKDEKGNQNWGRIGFIWNKVNCRFMVVEMGQYRNA
jgi:hypothetical protein